MKNKIESFLHKISNKTIAIIGDVMLDQYFCGNVSRVSPEAPVPVVDITSETYHLGGAANVAQNLKSLGCKPILCGLLGNDNLGNSFLEICDKMGLDTFGLFRDKNRITTVKTRIIGNGQQIVRMDKEITTPINIEGEVFFVDTLKSLPQLDGIIFEDYDKGTINKNLIKKIITFAKKNNIPIFVDPKFNNFSNYHNTTLFKPNKRETEVGLKTVLNSKENIIEAGNTIIKNFNVENVLITLGVDGMMLFEKNGYITSIPTIVRQVADVSGAGDTAIATIAAMYVSGMTISDAAQVANITSGIVCEKPGIVAIEKKELIKAMHKYY